MTYKVHFSLEYYANFKDAKKWYNKQQVGLGKYFAANVKIALNDIKKTPFFRVYYANIRCLQVPNFPYLIHFSIDETTNIIYILAVINTDRNPEISYLK